MIYVAEGFLSSWLRKRENVRMKQILLTVPQNGFLTCAGICPFIISGNKTATAHSLKV